MIMPVILLGGSADLRGQTEVEKWKQCKSDDPERSIAGCSALIQSAHETGINLAMAFYGRGLAYSRKGDYDRAISDYDQALRLNPDLANAFYGRGGAYAYKGDYDHAIQDYNQALRLNPNSAVAFYGRGWAYEHKGDYDHAR